MDRRTLFDKLWDDHSIVTRDDNTTLLWVDRHFVHEGSHHAFGKLALRGGVLAEPELTIGVADHYVPTRARELAISDPMIRQMVQTLQDNSVQHKFKMFGLENPHQGIVHVVGPEQGLTLPGMLVVCGDSHTSTHGAVGVIGFGIGATEVAHVLATQTIWQKKPRRMRLTFSGTAGSGVGAKDMALNWISKLGADGARGCAIEYDGPAVRALSMEGRLTLCNLSIEGGARCGLVAPDQTTFNWLRGRPFAPIDFDAASDHWSRIVTDLDAEFDHEVSIDMETISPIVTWGTSPEDALPITSMIPDPAQEKDPIRAAHISAALDYMGLIAGRPLTSVQIDQVFIGSCTNSRIEDLRAAAAVLSGHKARVPGVVSPGSSLVKQQAEQEGLDKIFTNAGLEWVGSGCSMCVGMNGDLVVAGKRCASTSNRNFRGRQGPGARTHLMSPAMAAAAAVTGRLADVRTLLLGRTI
jgi:3-isopropylmalate/(R)-2-methylmalate dehydratase large subunit|tara:strand:- start:15801 stop:17204 length:1404 start_codon:yes stop_codon:yes gene_type:complete